MTKLKRYSYCGGGTTKGVEEWLRFTTKIA